MTPKQMVFASKNFALFALVVSFSMPEAKAWPWGRRRDHDNQRRQQETYQPPVYRAQPVLETPEPLQMPYYRNNEWGGVVTGTVDKMNQSISEHFGQLERTGIGTMYGPKSSYAKLTPEQQKAWLASKKTSNSHISKMPARTSCIDFVLEQVRAGYEKVGKGARFQELKRIVVANNGQGAVLLKELEKDGWTQVYWNPDVANPSTKIRKETDTQGNHRPSHHAWTASTVKNKGEYLKGVGLFTSDDVSTAAQKVEAMRQRFPDLAARGLIQEKFGGLRVDPKNMVTNYYPTDPSRTSQDRVGIQKLYNAPLGVGIANGGYHVYLYSRGKIIESHSTRNPNDPTNIEVRDFMSWGRNSDEGFGSGIIAVPPASWGQ